MQLVSCSQRPCLPAHHSQAAAPHAPAAYRAAGRRPSARGGARRVRSGGTEAPTEPPSLAQLREGLAEAVKAEDFATAARLRDRIAETEAADPVVRAERELEQAIAEERFEVSGACAHAATSLPAFRQYRQAPAVQRCAQTGAAILAAGNAPCR